MNTLSSSPYMAAVKPVTPPANYGKRITPSNVVKKWLHVKDTYVPSADIPKLTEFLVKCHIDPELFWIGMCPSTGLVNRFMREKVNVSGYSNEVVATPPISLLANNCGGFQISCPFDSTDNVTGKGVLGDLELICKFAHLFFRRNVCVANASSSQLVYKEALEAVGFHKLETKSPIRNKNTNHEITIYAADTLKLNYSI